MVGISERVRKVVNDYLKDVSEIIPISKAFLYGSYAKGNYNEYSDVDIAVFSEDFNNKKFIDSTSLLISLTRKYKDICIEPVAFDMLDLYNNNPFIKEILNTGIELNIR